MPRIIEYPAIDSIDQGDYLVVDSFTDGTRKIKPSDLFLADSNPVKNSNNLVRSGGVWNAVNGIKDNVDNLDESVSTLTEDVNRLNEGGLDIKDNVIEQQISSWLDNHPEATTTVQNGSIDESKLSSNLKPLVMNYSDPMEYGAVGDGVSDDSDAIVLASAQGIIKNSNNSFYIAKSITLTNGIKDTSFIIAWDKTITINKQNVSVDGCDFSQEAVGTGRGAWLLSLQKDGIKVFNSRFHNASNCIAIGANISNITVSDNIFENVVSTTSVDGNGYGILLQNATKNVSIIRNRFINVERHCIYITRDFWASYPTVATNIYINNNQFIFQDGVKQDNLQQIAIAVRGAKNLYIDSNYVYGYTGLWAYNCAMHGFENVFTTNNIIEHMGYNGTVNHAMTIFYFVAAETETPSAIKNIQILNNVILDSTVGFINIGYGSYVIAGNKIEQSIDNNPYYIFMLVHVNSPLQITSLILRENEFTYVNPNNISNLPFICSYAITSVNPSAEFTYFELNKNVFNGGRLFGISAGDGTYGLVIQKLRIVNNVFNTESNSGGMYANCGDLYTNSNSVFVNGEKAQYTISSIQFTNTFMNDDAFLVPNANVQKRYGGNLIVNETNAFVPLAVHAIKLSGVSFTSGKATITIPNNVYNRMATASIVGGSSTIAVSTVRGDSGSITIELTDNTFSGTKDIFVLYLTQR